MRILLLIAHGSRRSAANDEIHRLAAALAARDIGCDAVRAAFLETAAPTIPAAIAAAVAEGAEQLLLLPYFLVNGRHVGRDIPELAAAAIDAHPGVEIRLADHLGARAALLDLLADEVRRDVAAD